ncbi:MAG: hypothetical protein ACJ8J0_10785 [Longimicrobiaceae bacterium]
MSMKVKFSGSVLLLGALLAGCDRSQPTHSPGAAAPKSGLAAVTYGFSQALRNDEVRATVRNAMRASLVSEHKLVLQEYVRTQSGQLLVETAAAAAGLTPAALRSQIDALPELDFYVASRDQRRSWQGSAKIAVVANAEQDAKVFPGFDASGKPVQQLGHEAMPGVEAVFVMHRAEEKFLRVYPQANVPGTVIQEPEDGEENGMLELKDADGKITRTQYVDMVPGGRLPQVDPNAATGPMWFPQASVVTSGPGVFFTWIQMEKGDGVGACELKFFTVLLDANGNSDGTQATHTAGSVECPGTIHTWETRFPPRGRRGSTYLPHYPYSWVRVDLYEEDTIGDDYFGNNAWNGDYGTTKPMWIPVCDGYGCYNDIGANLQVKVYSF